MGGQWQALANLAARCGELVLGREAIDLFVEAQGNTPQAQYLKAAFLEQTGSLREAYDLMQSLPANVPDPASNAYSLGTAAMFLGRTNEAREQLERATRLGPQLGAAWLSLATVVDLSLEPSLADQIVAAERHITSAIPAQQAAYYYALGKSWADRGEHAEAFAAFTRGARQMKALAPYNRLADRTMADNAVRGYSADGIATIASRQTLQSARSIFVTGIPRSGTTLVEHILASHSMVTGGGEANILELLAREARGNSWSALNTYVSSKDPADTARLWDYWLDQRFPGSQRIVDKSLMTPRLIGLAAALLPEAPLIWLTRDPLDRAWSCFRTFFVASMPWSYDLEDIASFTRLEDGLLEQWQAILGNRLLVVPYEELVTTPEQWITRILTHCGLEVEPQVFAPHRSDHKVTTASVAQVRRPINRGGIEAAAPYRPYLEPFMAAYYG